MKLIKSLLLLGWLLFFISCDDDDDSVKVYLYTGIESIDDYAMTTDSQGNIIEFDWMPEFDRAYTMFEITEAAFELPETGIAGVKKVTYNGDGTVTGEGIDDFAEDFIYTVSVSEFEQQGFGQLLIKDDNGDFLFPACNSMSISVQYEQELYAAPSTCGVLNDLAAHTQAEYLDHHDQGDTLGISYVQLRYELQD